MRVKISDGVREVEVKIEGGCEKLPEIEAAAQRLYSVIAPAGKRPPIGFNGWSTLSETERQPEE